MLSALYAGLLVFNLCSMAYLLFRFKGRISPYYLCLYGCLLVSALGYMLIYNANHLESALFSNLVVYLGSAFSPYFLMLCIADLCKTRISTTWKVVGGVLGAFIFLAASSYGVVDWYYKSVELIIDGRIHFLRKVNGPLHIVYPIYLGISISLSIIFVVRAMLRKKDVSYKNSIALVVCLFFAIAVYVTEKGLHLNYEILPFGQAILEIVCMVILTRISKYDIPSITSDMMLEKQTEGFALFDEKGRYLASDEVAKKWFPELGMLQVDKALGVKNTDFLEQIFAWLEGKTTGEKVFFQRENVIVGVSHTIIDQGFSRDIHCISMSDETKQQEYTKLVEGYNENLTKAVEEKTEKLRHVQDDIIISMASIVENRDSNTGGHIKRTSDVIGIFAQHLRECAEIPEMTKVMKRLMIKAAPLHDFGKIAVPDRILNKPGRFDPDEYEIMKTHSAKGAVIVERILQNSDNKAFKRVAVNVAHYHHEKWDGSGYPEGIAGLKIPFEARVMALADVFDALVSKRVYKDSFSYEKAFQIIEESSGTHFDPELCREFLHCKNELIRLYDSYTD